MKAMRDNPRQLIIYLYLLVLVTMLITYGTEALASAPEEESRAFSVGPKTIDSGLDALDNYRTVFEIDYDGYRAEQPVSGRVALTRTVITSDSALHQVQQINAAGGNPPLYPISEYFKVGDTVVVRRGDELIQVEADAPEKFGQYALEKWFVLPKLVGTAPTFGKLGPTNVQEYVFDDTDLNDPRLKFEATQGQMWVNTAGNFVMAYALTGTVKAESPLDGAYLLDEGTVSLRYRVLETDASLTIDLPPVGAKNVLVALPQLPEAHLTTVFPTYVELTSPTSPISATLFYQDELTAQGWKSQTAAVFREKAALTFAKGRQAVTILITPTQIPGFVQVVLESGQSEVKPQTATRPE